MKLSSCGTNPNPSGGEPASKRRSTEKLGDSYNARCRLARILQVHGKLRSNYKERRFCLSQGIESCLREFDEERHTAIISEFERQSIGVGILRCRLSTFLIQVTEEACRSGEEHLFEYVVANMWNKNFVIRVIMRLAGWERQENKYKRYEFEEPFESFIAAFISSTQLRIQDKHLMKNVLKICLEYERRSSHSDLTKYVILLFYSR